MSWPQMRIVPPVFMTSPAMMLISVDLPAPLGPSSPKMPPSGTSKLTPLSASLGGASPCPAYSLTRSRISIAACAVSAAIRGPYGEPARPVKGGWLLAVVKAVLTMFRAAAFTAPARTGRMRLGYFRQPRLPGRLSLRQRAAGAWLALLAFGAPTPALAQAVTDSQVVDRARGHPRNRHRWSKIVDMDFGRHRAADGRPER